MKYKCEMLRMKYFIPRIKYEIIGNFRLKIADYDLWDR